MEEKDTTWGTSGKGRGGRGRGGMNRGGRFV